MTPADLLTWPFDLLATVCAVYLGSHCRSVERAYLLQTHWMTDQRLRPRLVRADLVAGGLTALVLVGVWL